MKAPQPGDIVYTQDGDEAYVREVVGFVNAKADGNPEWWYVVISDGTTVRVVRLGEGGPWQVERRLGST